VPTGGSSSTATPFGGTSVMRPVRRPGRPASSQRGSVAYGSNAKAIAVLGGGLAYHVYADTGAGDPINYAAPIATVSGTTWTSGTLAAPGTWCFGVRAFDGNGEEQNLDCSVVIVLDANGNDITNRPMPPVGLRGFATPNASIRVEWYYPPTCGPKVPTGFNVYIGTGGTPNYSAPAATVAFNLGIFNTFVSNLSGPSGGTTYTIGVRAYNASGEETNSVVVSVAADATGPAAVDSLVATPIV
jgi:hypothetical protein